MVDNSAPHAGHSQRGIFLALSVGLVLFAVYLLAYRGGFHSVDEVSMFAVTESLVKFGQLNTDQIAWTQWTTTQREAQGFFGVDGHVYSKKGLAISLAMAPLYWLGLLIPGLGMLQTASMLNLMLTAGSGALLVLFVRRLGYGDLVAVGTALLYGLATIAAVYSKYLFSEPLAGLLLLAAAYLLVAFGQDRGGWRPALAGFAAGLAVLARANNLFLVPVFGLYLLWITDWVQQKVRAVFGAEPEGDPGTSGGLSSSPGFAGSVLLPVIYFVLGLALPALLLMGYNWMRSGNPLVTGYDLTIFSPNILLGLYKLLFSPLRGLFVYSPLLILSLPGLIWLWQRRRAEAALVAGCVGITVLLFAAWTSGEGLSWGSRFLVPVVPLLCVSLAPVVERALEGDRLLRVLLIVLGGLSLFFQLLGLSINPWVYLSRLQSDFGGEFFLEKTAALADFRYAQVVGQIQSWSLVNSDVAWWQPWGLDGVALGLSVFLLAAAIFVLLSILRRPGGQRSGLMLLLALVLTGLVTFGLLRRYYVSDLQFGAAEDAYTTALEQAAARSSPGDQIVTVAPYHYHVAMNRFKPRMPIKGFARQLPPLPATALPLLADAVSGDNTWLVTVGFPPAAPDNAAEAWLSLSVFKAADEWLDDVRLVRYGTPWAAPAAERSVSAVLGGELELVSARALESAETGTVLPVELVWLPLQQPESDYNLFLQLLDAGGTVQSQHDGPPNGAYTPTSGWEAGREVVDRHGLVLPVDLAPGEYRLIVGLVDPVDGQRLPVDDGSGFVDLGLVAVQSPYK